LISQGIFRWAIRHGLPFVPVQLSTRANSVDVKFLQTVYSAHLSVDDTIDVIQQVLAPLLKYLEKHPHQGVLLTCDEMSKTLPPPELESSSKFYEFKLSKKTVIYNRQNGKIALINNKLYKNIDFKVKTVTNSEKLTEKLQVFIQY
jgi:hypothetical protein